MLGEPVPNFKLGNVSDETTVLSSDSKVDHKDVMGAESVVENERPDGPVDPRWVKYGLRADELTMSELDETIPITPRFLVVVGEPKLVNAVLLSAVLVDEGMLALRTWYVVCEELSKPGSEKVAKTDRLEAEVLLLAGIGNRGEL